MGANPVQQPKIDQMEYSFRDLFPDLLDEAHELYAMFTGIAMVVVFAGLIFVAWRSSFGDLGQMMRGIVLAAIVAVVLSVFPGWVDGLQLMAHAVITEIDADPSESHQKFARLIAGPMEGDDQDVGFWDVLWADEGGLGKAVLYAVVLLMGKIALAIMWLFFLIQQLVLIFGIAVAPVFLSMLMLGVTRGIAIKYLISLLAIILWPLGWAVADIMTSALLEMAAGEEVYREAGGNVILSGSQTLFFMVVLSLWILVSTIAAPIAISKSLQYGTQIGSSLLQSLGAGLGQGTSYALGAGATASFSGGSSAAVGAAAAAGGVAGVVSGAAGSSGAIVPAAVGAMAVMAGGSSSGGNFNQKAEAIAEKAKR